jgi:hypothetical protein
MLTHEGSDWKIPQSHNCIVTRNAKNKNAVEKRYYCATFLANIARVLIKNLWHFY